MAKRAYGVGGGSTDTKGDVICLMAAVSSTDHYMTFETPEGTDYFAPAGKQLTITKLLLNPGEANGGVWIGYGDDGVAAGAAAPTTPKNMTQPIRVAVASVTFPHSVAIPIPAGKYPYIKSNLGGMVVTAFAIIE